MSGLWDQKTAAEATRGKAQGVWRASRVEIDSRRVKPGDLFVAIKGERFDGHEFAADALAKGAVAAVVSKPVQGNILLVEDTLKALGNLGRYARKRSKARVVGVTGSVGKTSTKEMIRLALSPHGKVFATTGNYNNHIGAPLNLANLPPDADFAVFEMGMNHAGEIAHLTRIVQPQVAIITNVESVHLEFFDSIEEIARAKAEIFDGLAKGCIAILPADSPQLPILKEEAGLRDITLQFSFGEHENADCRLLSYRADEKGSAISASISGQEIAYRLKTIGRHWGITSVIALAAVHALRLDIKKSVKALAEFSEPEGRGRVLRVGNFLLIDDSYNASPASMRAAFAKTLELGKGRKIAALGDMLELGNAAPQMHAALAADLSGFDAVFTAGTLMKHLHDALPEAKRGAHAAGAMDLLPLLQKELKPGDILLVKGSHGSKMYELANALMQLPEKKHAV